MAGQEVQISDFLDFRGPEFSSPPPAATDHLFSPQEVKLTSNIREYIEQRGYAVTGPLSRRFTGVDERIFESLRTTLDESPMGVRYTYIANDKILIIELPSAIHEDMVLFFANIFVEATQKQEKIAVEATDRTPTWSVVTSQAIHSNPNSHAKFKLIPDLAIFGHGFSDQLMFAVEVAFTQSLEDAMDKVTTFFLPERSVSGALIVDITERGKYSSPTSSPLFPTQEFFSLCSNTPLGDPIIVNGHEWVRATTCNFILITKVTPDPGQSMKTGEIKLSMVPPPTDTEMKKFEEALDLVWTRVVLTATSTLPHELDFDIPHLPPLSVEKFQMAYRLAIRTTASLRYTAALVGRGREAPPMGFELDKPLDSPFIDERPVKRVARRSKEEEAGI